MIEEPGLQKLGEDHPDGFQKYKRVVWLVTAWSKEGVT